jgi:nucleotide-binding universal stress UspA family protein
MATAAADKHTTLTSPDLFHRILVGVDNSRESVEAARQAARLLDTNGMLTVLSAWTLAPPIVAAGSTYSETSDYAPRRAAEAAIVSAINAVAVDNASGARVVRGTAWQQLVAEVDTEHATLLAVGSHGTGRMRGILIGSTATEIVHRARCSVLVARKADASFPRRIVVGVDGSPGSATAYAVAAGLAHRFDARLWPVVANGGKGVDRRVVATIIDYHHEDLPDEPVRALVAASTEADLVVVGSRGLHGWKALGSVSERVAHEAHCSTLIVRNQAI